MNTSNIVNMLPEIKTEPVTDDDGVTETYQLYDKYFVSQEALENKVHIKHSDLKQQGREAWTESNLNPTEALENQVHIKHSGRKQQGREARTESHLNPTTVIVEFDEDTVGCRGCEKTFVTEKALENHVRMEHFDMYSRGKGAWMTTLNSSAYSMDPKKFVELRTEEVLSSMVPTSLTTLASEDVSYIIVKADPDKLRPPTKKKKKVEKEKPARKQKEVERITGPFECLQPSSSVPQKICHQIFFSCCEYSTHYRDKHNKRRKGLRCQVCEKPLANPANEEGLPFTCEVCGLGFGLSDELEQHIANAHVKQRPYECSICHKRFTQKGGFQQHMRMHAGEKPYTCLFCSKTFSQKSGLGQHIRTHTKIKPYSCVICSKAFCQPTHLKQHMRTHTNVSPFECGICQKRFKQSSHLNYHLKYHNLANLTEEQKQKYTELIGMISTEDAENGELIESGEITENGEVIESEEVNDNGETNEYEIVAEKSEEVVQSDGDEQSTNDADVVVEFYEDDDSTNYIL